MDAIPAEVDQLIISHLDSKSDLANARQVSKSFSGPATERLFSRHHIILPALEDDVDSLILGNLNRILSNANLARAVRTLRYTTSWDPSKTFEDYCNDEETSEFKDCHKEAIDLIARFPNLTNLELEFSAACAVETIQLYGHSAYANYSPEEDIQYRFEILEAVFSTLNTASSKLTSLSIKNLQNHNDPDLTMSENFLAVLGRITELRLKIVTEACTASPESAWNIQEMHTFMEDLPGTWLEPARDNLTSLTLHMDDFWGYYPKCELRGIKFPRLKRLELGNYTFAHDWQLEWILSHGETLEKLVLDDCRIVKTMRTFGAVDEEHFTIWPAARQIAPEKGLYMYAGQWADYFKKMEEGLPKLKILKFGTGIWANGENFDGEAWDYVGLHDDRYTGFHAGTGPSPWVGLHNSDVWLGELVGEMMDDETYEEREVEDWAAYDSLMAALAKR